MNHFLISARRPRLPRWAQCATWLTIVLCLFLGWVGSPSGQAPRGVARIPDDAQAARRVGNRWALIVGVDQYLDRGITPLSGAVADAGAIRDVLIKYADFPESQTLLLASDGTVKPTKAAIFEKLAEIRGTAQPGDLLLLYFAGHGVEVDGQRYMLTYDTQCCTAPSIKSSALLASQLMQELESIKVAHRIIMVDACRNDPTKGGKALNVADENLEAAFTLQPASEGGLRATFLSSSRGQSAYEWTEKRRGFFSYFIEAGIRGEASQFGKVTVTSLLTYLNEMVPKSVREQKNQLQIPYTRVDGSELVLVRSEMLPAPQMTLDRPPTVSLRTIYGIVKDSGGIPLVGAMVKAVVTVPSRAVTLNAGQVELTATSDEDGFFKIDGVDASVDAKITVMKDGYEVKTLSSPSDQAGRKLPIFLPRILTIASNVPRTASLPSPARPTPIPAPVESATTAARAAAPPPPPQTAEAKPAAPTPRPESIEAKAPPAPPPPRAQTADAKPSAPAPPVVASSAPVPAPQPEAVEAKTATIMAAPPVVVSVEQNAQELALIAYRTFVAEDFNEAETVARRALAVEPDNVLANAVLGNSIAAVGIAANNTDKTTGAVEFISKALRRDPNQALARNALGVTLVAEKKYDEAVAELKKAIASDPRLAAAHANLAHVLLKQSENDKNPENRLKDAEREYREAIRLQPENSVPYNGLSTVLFSMGKYKDAVKACREAIGRYELRDGILGLYYVQLAVAQFQDGHQAEALEAIARAKALGVAQHDAYAIIEKGKPQKGRR